MRYAQWTGTPPVFPETTLEKGMTMKQLLTMLAAAIFAAVSVSAVAQAPKEEKKPSADVKSESKTAGATTDGKKPKKAKPAKTKGKKKAEGEAAKKPADSKAPAPK
jgi:hypothetical protein